MTSQHGKLCTRRLGGLTLLELLAIIVIISLAAGAVLVRLGPVHEDSALRSAAAAIQELDARARLYAQRGQRLMLEVRNDEHDVRLTAIETGEVVSRESLPPGSSLRFTIATEETSRVVFDRTGRSADYVAELVRNDRGVAWRVRGATGQVHWSEESR